MVSAVMLSSTLTLSPLGPADLEPIGPHQRLFLFEKSENPENVMVAFTKLTDTCVFESDREGEPLFDFYWLMDRRRHKPVHKLIKGAIRERLVLQTDSELLSPEMARRSADRERFMVRLSDLKEVKHDLPDPRLLVRIRREGGDCVAEALLTMGPSDAGTTIRLQSVFSEVEKTILPPFRRLLSVTLSGESLEDGRKIVRRFQAR